MLETVLGSIWWLIVALGILVTFHEFGHYWVARRCNVKVLKFSVGFGRSLWSRTAKDGTEWTVAAIPLGGYVKMLDEREGSVGADDLDEAFGGLCRGCDPAGDRLGVSRRQRVDVRDDSRPVVAVVSPVADEQRAGPRLVDRNRALAQGMPLLRVQ